MHEPSVILSEGVSVRLSRLVQLSSMDILSKALISAAEENACGRESKEHPYRIMVGRVPLTTGWTVSTTWTKLVADAEQTPSIYSIV